MRYLLLGMAMICLVGYSHAQSFEGSAIGKGIRFVPKDSSFSIQWNTRFQTQYVGVQNLESDEYSDAFTIRRFRLKFKGFLFNPNIQYKTELALSNRDQGDFFAEHNGAASIVLDAVLKWRFAPGWQLWVGQTKLPGNRERVISSGALQLVDRSRLNSRYNIDRDKGLQLHHEHKVGSVVLREIGSISSGEGRNVTLPNNHGYDYTGRIEVLPFGKFSSKGDYFGADLAREESVKLSLAATYDYNVGTSRERGQLGYFIFDETGEELRSTLSTVFVDAYLKYNGWSVMYEYAHKTVAKGEKSGFGTEGEARNFYTGQAHNIQGGYLFKNNLSIDGRFTDNQPDAGVDDPEKRYEIGFGKYIAGHSLKLQVSTAYRDRLTKDDEMLYFAQLEIGF
ncbi:OprO/OprP family phosphate-selective porin [Reichenbachiella ulvae]|uniref:OprO/OprP family phosphate-selective porin n=1 Tax=Reichenbachiella ulvae TaxID=2980104 RepID=A0ABT3CSA9_9BACT|nr:OprO/OprP family phosphate-selective porin [Reichenbachiella ulvae]MCV9386591.1 OprO/OprP family phosphate-selective porin [Reichenbachiella ulvae]